MIKISDISADSQRSYQNLDLIVDVLVAAGNRDEQPRWRLTKSGWLCVLVGELDFDLVRATFELPSWIELYDDRGTIGCTRTSAAIVSRGQESDRATAGI